MIKKVFPAPDFDMNQFDHIVRKNAHFFAYLVLGILVMNALRRSEVSGIKVAILTLGICALYAGSDEMHQLFVAGRSGQIIDVFIDSSGTFIGIGLYGAFIKLMGKNKKIIFFS